MKPGLSAAVAALFVLAASPSHALEETPPARRGFQLAIRSGAAIPLGSVSPTVKMSDALGVQVPLIVDVGAKVIPNLLLGGYVGVAVGGAAGQIEQACNQVGVNCTGIGFRFGVMAQWNFRPDKRVNPWLGYAFGYELGGSSGSNDPNSVSNSIRGFEFGHLLAGIDFRLQDYFGVGPFVDASLGRYDYAKNEINSGGNVVDTGGTLAAKSFHSWVIIGLRATMFP